MRRRCKFSSTSIHPQTPDHYGWYGDQVSPGYCPNEHLAGQHHQQGGGKWLKGSVVDAIYYSTRGEVVDISTLSATSLQASMFERRPKENQSNNCIEGASADLWSAGSKSDPPYSHQSQRCSTLLSITFSYFWSPLPLCAVQATLSISVGLFIQELMHFTCSETLPSFIRPFIFPQLFLRDKCDHDCATQKNYCICYMIIL